MKQDLLQEIESQLTTLGIRPTRGKEADLAIDTELVDAGFSTGKKKLRYEALILLDESDKTAKMYEKTTETSAGLSFGMSAETSMQSGGTLFRKVKSIQYGPEGKVFEYNFDLGAIPKTVKAAAQAAGWKFKTVVIRKNAMYR
ncbi:MAG: hypothetical protein VB062_09875 [Christensenella sp.]|nr:hypothetical protein [Christensenella sp.]